MLKKIFNLPNTTLLVALALSSIAAWFAIVGLIAIFPAKATAIIIMGGAIELGKVITTIWLRKYWDKAGLGFKFTLVPMVCVLMLLTSMGTFGFLSAAHSEQSAVTGDAAAKVALIDEKIKTQRDNVEVARKALAQLDSQVEQRLSRSDDERGAERAVQIRRQQAPERTKLQQEITAAQAIIAKLNEERAPIASEVRKLEAEVGPIKYIAALVYGDNPDANVLEKSVRLVIILLVLVFDPLAIALVLAGNASKKWENDEPVPEPSVNQESEQPATVLPSTTEIETKGDVEGEIEEIPELTADELEVRKLAANSVVGSTPWPTVWDTNNAEEKQSFIPQNLGDFSANTEDLSFSGVIESDEDYLPKPFNINEHPYLFNVPSNRHPPGVELAGPQVYKEEVVATVDSSEITTDDMVAIDIDNDGLADLHIDKSIVKSLQEELMNGFGTEFPKVTRKGSVFVKVDTYPHKVYKFDGKSWNEIDKSYSDSYIQNVTYLQFLIKKIESGECDVDTLTDVEREYISSYLEAQK